LQYSSEAYEFINFDVATGAAQSTRLLDGSPAFKLMYPGGLGKPAGVQLSSDKLSVVVNQLEGDPRKWTFNLGNGRFSESSAERLPAFGEENSHSRGGK